MFEKEPPHNYEAECSVIGCILLKPELIYECRLKPNEFYDSRHILIMEYFYFLSDLDKGPINFPLMAEYVGNKNKEVLTDFAYMTRLTETITSAHEFNFHQIMVRDKATRRKAMQIMSNKADQADVADTPADYISESIHALEALLEESGPEKEVKRLGDVLRDHESELQKRKDVQGLTGTKTTSRDLDKLTGGNQKQDLIIVAARPSMGKSDYMVSDAIKGQENAWKEGIAGSAAVIFSLEMKDKLIAERALCNLGNIDNKVLKSGDLSGDDWMRWSMAMSHLNDLNIFIDDTPGLTLRQIDRKVERLVKKFPNLTVYVDFLQKVRTGFRGQKTHERVAEATGGLKTIARKHDVPVIALSAVGRDCEKRQDKRPMMSDLRDSGSIESDADIVAFLYRDEYYDRQSEKKGIIEIIVAKGRNVGTGLVEMAYQPQYSKFLDLDRTHHEKAGGSGERSQSNKGNE